MILVTGDTHGEVARFMPACLPGEEYLTPDDYVIVCGDFMFVYLQTEDERKRLEELAKKPYTILFVDGNHDNFNLLNALPVEMWCGGKVHKVRPNVIHLMRGQVFEIEGKRIFTFGGGYSFDRALRKEGYNWWPEEMPTKEEKEEAWKNLAKVDFCVDYIITHTGPEETMRDCLHLFDWKEASLNIFLELVRDKTKYKHWYFGHMHDEKDFWRDQTLLWFDVRNLETGESLIREA